MKKITSLRMERQFLISRANEQEYIELYRDMQPGLNVYWNGFGQPPTLSFRAAFDDIEFNRVRQGKRELIKGRFAGGNLGWIVLEDLELFIALYRKPLTKPTEVQLQLLELIERLGPLNIQQNSPSINRYCKGSRSYSRFSHSGFIYSFKICSFALYRKSLR